MAPRRLGVNDGVAFSGLHRLTACLALIGNLGTAGSNELHDKVPSTSMRGILLLAVLSVKSSYSREEETALESAEDIPDTLQWWFGDLMRLTRHACLHVGTPPLNRFASLSREHADLFV